MTREAAGVAAIKEFETILNATDLCKHYPSDNSTEFARQHGELFLIYDALPNITSFFLAVISSPTYDDCVGCPKDRCKSVSTFRNVTELVLFGVKGKNARTLAPGRRQSAEDLGRDRQEPLCAIRVARFAKRKLSTTSRFRSRTWRAQGIGTGRHSVFISYRRVQRACCADSARASSCSGWKVRPGTISHFMFGVDDYDADVLRVKLAAAGLEPQMDSDSFHVRDPDGLNVQVGDRGLGLASGIVENGFKMK
jgi:hypothetical protein